MNGAQAGTPMASGSPLGEKLNAYVPPKDWSDITADEKIERLREIIKSLMNQLGQNQTAIHNLRLKLKNHDHFDGKVYEMKEIKDYDDSMGLCGVAGQSTQNNFF